MLTEVKARAEADLKLYQQESTELYNRNLTAMKCQLDDDIKKIEQLTNENLALNDRVGHTTAQYCALEGKVCDVSRNTICFLLVNYL